MRVCITYRVTLGHETVRDDNIVSVSLNTKAATTITTILAALATVHSVSSTSTGERVASGACNM